MSGIDRVVPAGRPARPDGAPGRELDTVMDGTSALLGVMATATGPVLEEVTMTQFRALHLLRRHGPMRLRDLAEGLGNQPPAVSRLATRLQAGGYLTREPAPDSRREVAMTLTPAGEALVQDVMSRRRAALAGVLALLSDTERAALVAGLAALAGAVHEKSEDTVLLGSSAHRATRPGLPGTTGKVKR